MFHQAACCSTNTAPMLETATAGTPMTAVAMPLLYYYWLSTIVSTLYGFTHSVTQQFRDRYYLYLHFRDEETDKQTDLITCPRPQKRQNLGDSGSTGPTHQTPPYGVFFDVFLCCSFLGSIFWKDVRDIQR